MATQPIHTKLLNQAGKRILKPLGIYQKGVSRTWLDDLGWRLTVIEFQPSAWSRGSYLNVGAMWLWYPTDYFSFDLGCRLENFLGFESEKQFAGVAESLAMTARERAETLRHELSTIHATAEILARDAHNNDGWKILHAGIACALAGKQGAAGQFLDQLIKEPCNYEWQQNRLVYASQLRSKLSNPSTFRQEIVATIYNTRQILKLKPALDINPPQT